MNARLKSLAVGLITALVASVPAHASTPGVDLDYGQSYAIEHCAQIQGGCSWTQIGADDQGSVSIRMADGETMSTYIGGKLVLYHESPGSTPADSITTVWGRLMVQGSVYTQAAPTITSDYTVADTDVTVLVDTSAHNVIVTLPSAVYHPGRRITVKKVSLDQHSVIIAPVSGGTLDGAASQSVTAQWGLLTVEGTPAGNPISGFTTNTWSVVGH